MRYFVFGFILAVSLMGCVAFSYKYYGLDAKSYDGSLLGPEPKDDIPFSNCEPDAQNKGKCVVMLTPEFYRMKQDYEQCVQQLSDCQRNCKP